MENRIELYNVSVNKLIEAYRNGTLEHGSCNACAVGNLCDGDRNWSLVFSTMHWSGGDFEPLRNIDLCDSPLFKNAIAKAGGYAVEELMRIEYAFESSLGARYASLLDTDEGRYIGLCAVLDVLWDIHGIEDQSDKEQLTQVAEAKGVTV